MSNNKIEDVDAAIVAYRRRAVLLDVVVRTALALAGGALGAIAMIVVRLVLE